MENIIDICDTINLIKQLDEDDEILIEYLTGIDEYTNILLSKESKINKLLASFEALEKITPVFLNKYLFRINDDLNDKEINLINILLELRECTDTYFDLLSKEENKKSLENLSKLYTKKIIKLSEKYREAMKETIRTEIIEECKSSNTK